MSDETDTTITLVLDQDATVSLQGLIQEAIEKGGPLQQRAAHELAELLTKAMIEQLPGLKDAAREAIEGMADELPDGAAETMLERLEADAITEAEPITEEEVDGTQIEDVLDRIRREGEDDEEEAA